MLRSQRAPLEAQAVILFDEKSAAIIVLAGGKRDLSHRMSRVCAVAFDDTERERGFVIVEAVEQFKIARQKGNGVFHRRQNQHRRT